MPTIVVGGRAYECPPGATLLEGLEAHGVPMRSSCRAGSCQSCMVRAVSGDVPEAAQVGLKATLRARNYLLACVCRPTGDMEIVTDDDAITRVPAEVVEIGELTPDVMSIRLRPEAPYEYRAGQFLRLYRDDQTSRCYSLASVCELDRDIELHVTRVPKGQVSNWIHESAHLGQTMTISEATGNCFYVPGKPEQPILLVGTGSGLGSLLGIVRDALRQGHTGPIRLYHGTLRRDGLYGADRIAPLAHEHLNLRYVPCVLREEAPPEGAQGSVVQVALTQNQDLTGWRVFLCGDANLVAGAKREAFLAGASMDAIHADPFLPS